MEVKNYRMIPSILLLVGGLFIIWVWPNMHAESYDRFGTIALVVLVLTWFGLRVYMRTQMGPPRE